MCVIGLIDDFTEDYSKRTFRITTICQDESEYYEHLRLYYRKYYSAERVESMMTEVKALANNEGVIMACLKHLTSFIYKSIADKRARGILDMEQFCNMAISSKRIGRKLMRSSKTSFIITSILNMRVRDLLHTIPTYNRMCLSH